MRLLNSHTLKFKSFEDDRSLPPYAILSHTWGPNEVLFEEVLQGATLSETDTRHGVWKILRCAEQARKDGYKYFWVDTCCIQKSSSAELSEAINSMFRWYKNAAICYAYLGDVPDFALPSFEKEWGDWTAKFKGSRWFTRGWTLQELLGPRILRFFSQGWQALGLKESYSVEISEVTKIPIRVLVHGDISVESVACRMSWAAKRTTTRIEDMAYCLLGLFDVNMPLLYGEGERAFQRLQEEIINVSDDDSIFAWKAATSTFATWRGLLANSPSEFADSGCIVAGDDLNQEPHAITSRAIKTRLPLHKRTILRRLDFFMKEPEQGWESKTEFLAFLQCQHNPNRGMESPYVGIFIKRINGNREYIRVDADQLLNVPSRHHKYLPPDKWSTISFSRRLGASPWRSCTACFRVRGFSILVESKYVHLTGCLPEAQWNKSTGLVLFDEESMARGQRQNVRCLLSIGPSPLVQPETATLSLIFEPRAIYRGSTCAWKLEEGNLSVDVHCTLRIMNGEVFNAVSIRVRQPEAAELESSQ